MFKRTFLPIAVVVLIVLIIAGIVYYRQENAAPPKAPMMPPMPVTVTTAKQTVWPETVNSIGTVSANQGVMLKAETAGRITDISFKSHESVKKGQVLVQLYPNTLEAQLAQAKSQIGLDKLNYERAHYLFKHQGGSEQEMNQAQATLLSHEAQVKAIESQLSQTTIRAPFAGRLGLRQVSLGDYLSPGDQIVELQSTQDLRVEFSIPQRYLSELKVGDDVNFTTQTFPGKTFHATVYAYNASLNEDSRELSVWARIHHPPAKLLPGSFVKTELLINPNRKVVHIPQPCIVFSLYGDFVYVVNNGTVKQVMVKTGVRKGGDVIIEKGLTPGDVVVQSGQQKIGPGSKVMIVNKMKKGPAKKA